MFTGIVEHLGRIAALETSAAGGRLRIHAGPLAASCAIAGSIAVNGCCLTVVEAQDETFAADLSLETLRRTAFGELKAGARVNIDGRLPQARSWAAISCRDTSMEWDASRVSCKKERIGGWACACPRNWSGTWP